LFAEIDLSLTPLKPKLQLCKNDLNKTIIANLKSIYNITQKITLGNISELEIDVPFLIDKNHVLVDNPIIDKLINHRLIKFTKGDYVENYIITSITNNSDDNSDFKHIKCLSLGFELSFKKLYSYSVISYNATDVLTDILSETIWSIDVIENEFDLIFRSFDFNAISVLDALQQVAETFGGILLYNTITRKISLYNLDSIGTNKGLTVKYGKLLKNIVYENDSSELCTRLRCFGRDELSINDRNPTGSNFIENYAFVLGGFTRD